MKRRGGGRRSTRPSRRGSTTPGAIASGSICGSRAPSCSGHACVLRGTRSPRSRRSSRSTRSTPGLARGSRGSSKRSATARCCAMASPGSGRPRATPRSARAGSRGQRRSRSSFSRTTPTPRASTRARARRRRRARGSRIASCACSSVWPATASRVPCEPCSRVESTGPPATRRERSISPSRLSTTRRTPSAPRRSSRTCSPRIQRHRMPCGRSSAWRA